MRIAKSCAAVHRIPTVMALMLALALPGVARAENDAAAAAAWGFSKSEITPDKSVRFGVLGNGMRYAIMRNETPRNTVAVRLRFDVGSTAEAADQRGLAHFLEHMAFNGSAKVPEGEMVKLLERLGLAFGPDTNASTGFTETVYMLDLPQASATHIDTALMLMRETASALTISPGAVDRERGIILSEQRARENFALRAFQDQINFLVPGTAITRGLPIGDSEVIRKAPPERIRNLYQRYYTPKRATLVIVGEVDPDAIEAKIRASFADWKAAGELGADPDLGKVVANRPRAADSFIDPDVPTTVSINSVRPYVAEPDSVALRQRRLLQSIGNGILSRRLARLVRNPEARFAGGGASGSVNFQRTATTASVSVTAKDRDWGSALQIGEQELRRALTHGFTKSEVDEQIANIRTAQRNAVEQAATRRSTGLADAIIDMAETGTIFTSPESSLARFEAFAPRITPEAVADAFRSQWAGSGPLIHVSHNSPIEGGDAAILAAYDNSRTLAVAPPASSGNAKFAYTNFGQMTRIISDTRIQDLDIRTIQFANNVRLNIKKTDFEKGRVRVNLRVGGGVLEYPQTPEGLIALTSAYTNGGLAAHSLDELQSILAGRTVSVGFGAGGDAFGSSASVTPQDLQLQLQVMAAYLTAPGFRPEALAQFRNGVRVSYPTLDATPQGVAARDVARIIAGGDKRAGVPKLEDMTARTFDELKPVISKSLATGPIEIAIVGDVDEKEAISAVAATFGALPERMEARPDYGAILNRSFPASRKPITLTHSGKADQGMVLVYWPTTDDRDAVEEQRHALLARVFGVMLTDELREKMSATYSPSTASIMSSVFKGYGYMTASTTVDPARAADVFAAIDRVAKTLAKKPVAADLIARARTPMLEGIVRARRENAAWIGLIDEAQTQPGDLDRFRQEEARLKAITGAELQAVARRYLKPGSELRISIVPRAK